jgi:hypothetical protein
MDVKIGVRWPGEHALGSMPPMLCESYFVENLPDGVRVTAQHLNGKWRFSTGGLGPFRAATAKPSRCPVFASREEVLEAIKDFLRSHFVNSPLTPSIVTGTHI